MKLLTTEQIVENVLREQEETRSDDFLLVYAVYNQLNSKVSAMDSFSYVMSQHKELGLPSWATITRVRRKVFERYPDLKPEKITEIREEKEEEFIEYSRT